MDQHKRDERRANDSNDQGKTSIPYPRVNLRCAIRTQCPQSVVSSQRFELDSQALNRGVLSKSPFGVGNTGLDTLSRVVGA
jgi:hypothetical protein